MNRKILIVAMLALFAGASSCRKTEREKPQIAPVDTTITREVSYTTLFLDSSSVNRFVQVNNLHKTLSSRIRSFYNSRNFQFAWFFPEGPADYIATFLGMQSEYVGYSGDSTVANRGLSARIDSIARMPTPLDPSNPYIRETELDLTRDFFRYAYRTYAGTESGSLKELDWFIPKRKVNTVAFLDSLIKNKGQNVAAYEPINPQYNLLKKELIRYGEIRKAGGWDTLKLESKYVKGDTSLPVKRISERLKLLGDWPAADSSGNAFEVAVKSFQSRNGLKPDGAPGKAFIDALNAPVQSRIEQIMVNMERLRWMPSQPTGDYLLVNIPEFQLHAYENGKPVFDMVVVVGNEANNTVIFSGMLSTIVFSPYWNVPPGIMKREVLPAIRRNPNYLARNNMEWNGNSVRQKPGKNNALGKVKFLFPNSYNIYLHDTPSKSAFTQSSRAFSHGCIRLSEPKKLAEFLLRNESSWTETKIDAAMNAGKEKYVALKKDQQVPVVIGYFTSWVDRDGRLNFRKDIYGHDAAMKKRLFGRNGDLAAIRK